MKITAVLPKLLERHGPQMAGGSHYWIFVKVETDDPDLTGWGEATLRFKRGAVVGAITDFEGMLLGEDPRRLEHLWQRMYRHQFFKGGIVTMAALSAIDQALHDIVARSLGIPLYQLLGGKVRERVKVYENGTGAFGRSAHTAAKPEEFARVARESVDAGFQAIKFTPIPPTANLAGNEVLDLVAERVNSVRATVGASVDVMLDFHGRPSPAMAVRYIDAVAEARPFFIEEPCLPETVGGLEYVATRTRIPIATGERLSTRWEFLPLLESQACSVIQPDVSYCGGVAEARKISALGEIYGAGVAFHNPLGPIATMVSLHAALAVPNFLSLEVLYRRPLWDFDGMRLPISFQDGWLEPPEGIGIGLEVDEEILVDKSEGTESTLSFFNPHDGSVVEY